LQIQFILILGFLSNWVIFKSEARISKSETNTKFKNSNVQNKGKGIRAENVVLFLSLEFLLLEIISNFVLRISDLISTEIRTNLAVK